MDLTAPEIRVLGCLLEKQRTTPDAYPLTLNGLRLACNQSTNRDPVVDYDDATVREAVRRLERRGWARLASGAGSRAPKYRHLLDEALPMSEAERAVMCLLMLRGPQTPGEVRQRAERMHPFASPGDVIATLDRLVERDLVRREGRRPGQKEQRFAQILDADRSDGRAAAFVPAMGSAAPSTSATGSLPAEPIAAPVTPAVAGEEDWRASVEERLARLEREVLALRRALGE